VAEPEVTIFADAAALARAAVSRWLALAETAVAARGRFSVALSGGSTPRALFELLGQPPFAAALWAQTHVFWSDERLVPPDDPGSNYRQAQDLLLSRAPLPAANVHRVHGELNPQAAAEAYTKQLHAFAAGRGWPRFDLVLLGLGSDGHTASLFPGEPDPAEQRVPVLAVTADYQDRPARRVTFTPLLINAARHVLFLVSGADKANALAATLRGPHDPARYPAQRIRPVDGALTWLVDQAAARRL
jgi:6-phosphogluconolactonase